MSGKEGSVYDESAVILKIEKKGSYSAAAGRADS